MPEIVTRPSSPHHRTAILDDWSKGVVTVLHRRQLGLDQLADAVGFVIDRAGKIRTEPAFFPAPSTGLPSRYRVIGAGCRYDVWDAAGNYAGEYWLALHEIDTNVLRLYYLPRQGTVWSASHELQNPATNLRTISFASLNNRFYVSQTSSQIGLRRIISPAPGGLGPKIQIKTRSGSVVGDVEGGGLAVHQSRLWVMSYRTIRFSEVNDGETFYSDSYINAISEEPSGEADTGVGFWGVVKMGLDALLVFSATQIFAIQGYPPRNLSLRPTWPTIPNLGGIAATHGQDPGGIIFLTSQNELVRVESVGGPPQLLSAPILRRRQATQDNTEFYSMACSADYLYVRQILPQPYFWTWDRNQFHQNQRLEGDYGWVCNLVHGAWTRSAYLPPGVDSAPSVDRKITFFKDVNWGRIIAVANKPNATDPHYLLFQDWATLPSVGHFNSPTLLNPATHYVETGDMDFAYDGFKWLSEIRVKALPTNPFGSMNTNYRVYVRFDGGAWNQVWTNNQEEATSSSTWRLDGTPRRGRYPGPPFRYLGIRIEYSNNGAGEGLDNQGMWIDKIEVDYYTQDPNKL